MNNSIKTLILRFLSVILLIVLCDSCNMITKQKYERLAKKDVRACVNSSLNCLKIQDMDGYYQYVASSGLGIIDNIKRSVDGNNEEIKRAESDVILSYKITDITVNKSHDEAKVTYLVKYENGKECPFETDWKKSESGWKKRLVAPGIIGGGY